MRRLVRAAVLVLLGCALGLAWNAFSGRGFAIETNVFIKYGDDIVEAPEARKRLDKGALFLDARPRAFYELSHVPGALALSEDDFEASFARIEPRLRSSLDVIVYCAGFGCEASHIVARKLKDRGIPAAILHEGWPAWTEAGFPVKAGPEP